MDLMEELNAMLSTDLPETSKGKGEPVRFSEAEHKKCMEAYIKFSEEESRIERVIREERVRAAAEPEVFLTF
jgi:hypothetical protein